MKKFTLMELLIVIAIIGILVTLLLPSLGKARERALDAVCLSNQKQIGIMFGVYTVSHKSMLPNHRIGQRSYIEFINPSGDNSDFFKCPRIAYWTYQDGSKCIPDTSTVTARLHKTTYGYNGWWLGLHQYSTGMQGQPMSRNYMYTDEAASPDNLLVTADSRPIKRSGGFNWGCSVWYPARRNSNPDVMEGVYATHGSKNVMGNILYLDGHVSPRQAKSLNYDSDYSTIWHPDIDRWPSPHD